MDDIRNTESVEALLRAQINLLGRMAVNADELTGIVGGELQVKAYNLCDGTRTQPEVQKAVGLDQSNFRKTVLRWLDAGVVFKIPDDGGDKLLHLYPVAVPTKGKK